MAAQILPCRLSDLPDPGARGPFRVGDVSIFVVRHGERVRAFVDSCPHVGVALEMEPDRFLDLTGAYVLCSLHGAHFDPDSGVCVLGPCPGRRLTPYPLEVQGDTLVAGPAPDGLDGRGYSD